MQRALLCLALAFALAPFSAKASPGSANYLHPAWVVPGGGSGWTASANYGNRGSVGQPSPAGASWTRQRGNYAGFWHAVRGSAGYRADILAVPSSKSFGPVSPGNESLPFAFTITNTGSAALVTGTLTLAGTDFGEFEIRADACSNAFLLPGDSCTMDVVFKPVDPAGVKTAEISVPSNDADPSVLAIALDGLATAAARLDIAVAGTGRVRSTDLAIDCGDGGAACSANFPAGDTVHLSVENGQGWWFDTWGGACSGGNTSCDVVMSGDTNVTAALSSTPSVTTEDAGGVGTTGANVSCTVNANGALTTQWVDYGQSPGIGTRQALGTAEGYNPATTAANLSGLLPDTDYSYQCGGQNTRGTTLGSPPKTFRTDPAGGGGCGTPAVKIMGGVMYTSLQRAYEGSYDGAVLLLNTPDIIVGDLDTTDWDYNVLIEGGWDCGFAAKGPGLSEIQGTVTIGRGMNAVEFDGVAIW